jgi:hypothetical protein
MLSNALPLVDGKPVGQHPVVIRLLKGVFNQRPPQKSLVPEWDLLLVLKRLQLEPFEPLKEASLKLVTYKFIILLSLVTARRVSNLTHLEIGNKCRIQTSKVTFLPVELSKADDPSHFMQEVVVTGFPENPKLCVLRVFKHYLRRTENLRSGEKSLRLLRCISKPHNPPSPKTVSRWIVNVIKMCYEIDEGLCHKVKAHSVRAIAPSWAKFLGAPKDKILSAADWRRDTTFTKFYLRELSEEQTTFGKAVLRASDLST